MKTTPTYEEEIDEIKAYGLHTYDPKKNVRYRRIMYAIEDAAVEDEDKGESHHSEEDEKPSPPPKTPAPEDDTG